MIEAHPARAAPHEDPAADATPGLRSMSIGRSACRSARTATSTAMCGPEIDEARYLARVPGRDRPPRRARARPRRPFDLLRRRHALADAPATVGGIIDAIAGPGRSSPTRRSPSKPTRPASKPAAFAAIAAPASTGCRSACRRSPTPTSRRSGDAIASEEALAAVRLAAALFPRFTFDLIYGRPGQSLAAWRAELARALDLAGDHLSLYQLTIEPDTAFERLRDAGKLVCPTRT